jgi:hypothetical protein
MARAPTLSTSASAALKSSSGETATWRYASPSFSAGAIPWGACRYREEARPATRDSTARAHSQRVALLSSSVMDEERTYHSY